MVAPLKVNGIKELGKLKRRTQALHSLGRIRKSDMDFIVDHLNKIEARIIRMREEGVDEEIWL